MNRDPLCSLSGGYTLLELDNVFDLAQRLGIAAQLEAKRPALTQILLLLGKELGPHGSGVVLDPLYTAELLKDKTLPPGKALRLEPLAETTDPQALPLLSPEWGIEHISENYATPKFELWYHPAEEHALAKKQLVAELFDYAHSLGLGFLLSLQLYERSETAGEAAYTEAYLEMVNEFARSCSVMALPPPPDTLTAATVTTSLDVPWLIHVPESEYAANKETLRSALESGAQGCLVGSCLWSELSELKRADASPDWEAIKRFVTTTARDRLIELGRIVDEYRLAEKTEA